MEQLLVRALVYKIPEGTWLLVAISLIVLVATKRSAAGWFDELALWTVPVAILVIISLLTDINLGLRYVLAILPYVFISTGKVVPWCLGFRGTLASHGGIDRRRVARPDDRGLPLDTTELSLVFQLGLWRPGSGAAAPDRQQPRLGPGPGRAPAWWKENIPDQPIGLAYFGQINPSIFEMRGEPFRWFLPPGRPGKVERMPGATSPRLIGPARKLTPGYYAVSASCCMGCGGGSTTRLR